MNLQSIIILSIVLLIVIFSLINIIKNKGKKCAFCPYNKECNKNKLDK